MSAPAGEAPGTRTDFGICPLCEAICGIAVEHDGRRILSIRGDPDDPFSRGHVCPKAVALRDVHEDPDRVRRPLRRRGDTWEEIGWDEALDEVGRRIAEVQRAHGRDAVALYYGNPTGHSYAAMLTLLTFAQMLGTRNLYSSNSVDALPRMLTSALLYGNLAVIPVPDLDRTDFLLVLGANPVVSNGSIMTAPDVAGRLKALRARGGRLVVVDPRRTETAALADAHHFIRPGTDALLLAAMLHTLFAEGRVRPGRLESMLEGLHEIRERLAPFAPARVSAAVGIAAEDVAKLARDFAAAPSAVCYGRMGTCVQEFGALATWLVDVLNAVTGNLDRPGGAMFTTPAVDLPAVARLFGQTGRFGRWRSRVSGLPEFNQELPVAAFAEEMETPGPGQIRALVTHAGNPVLSLPNGRRLDRALAGLDFMVAVDIYVNETTRHADVILPPTTDLEHDQYPLLFHGVAIRNTAHYAPALLAKPAGALDDWEILLELIARIGSHRGGLRRPLAHLQRGIGRLLGPRGLLGLLLRLGPHRLSLRRLEASPHGIDLGPLEPRLARVLRGRRLRLVPEPMARDLARLERRLGDGAAAANGDGLVLVSRRTLRSNNSWMHNSHRLVRGRERCTLLMHPEDARRRGLGPGGRVRVASRVGEIEAPLEVSDEVMPGVVSLPHGWGHDRDGTRLAVARAHAGTSVNDVTDDARVDQLSGVSSLSGVPVTVTAVRDAPRP
jgi:anaerobic selenocysteine-containing dehydrogenase